MAEGMPKPRKPQSTYDTIRNRGRNLDEDIDAASGVEPKSKAADTREDAKERKQEAAGMPKPSMLTRVLKQITGK